LSRVTPPVLSCPDPPHSFSSALSTSSNGKWGRLLFSPLMSGLHVYSRRPQGQPLFISAPGGKLITNVSQ
jgi:hypothetical protein